MDKWDSAEAAKRGAEIIRQKTVNRLFDALDILCKGTNRDIFVILPEDPKEQIPYLKHEIQKCLDLL